MDDNLCAFVRKEYGKGYALHGDKANHALCVSYVAQSIESLLKVREDGLSGELWDHLRNHIDWFEVASKLVSEYVPMGLNF